MKMPLRCGTLIALLAAAPAVSAFELSSSYAASADIYTGYYACRSGLDFSTFTSEFDLYEDGTYVLRGYNSQGQVALADGIGAIEFVSGPFASDDTAITYGQNSVRLSDGNPVIIIRYDFGDTVTDDYCALVE